MDSRGQLLAASDPSLAPSGDITHARAIVERTELPHLDALAHRTRILAFIDQHPDALHRSCVEGHLTGSALVVEAETDRLLIMFHRKLQRWLQPGGHADGDANLAAVALREATEETGIEGLMIDPVPIDIDIHRVSPPGEVPHDHLDVRFLVSAPTGAQCTANHESEGFRWVSLDEFAVLDVDPGMLRMAAAGLDRLRQR